MRRGDVSRPFSRLHDIMQRLHRLLDRRCIIPPVNLMQIHIIHLQPAQAVVDLLHDRFARKSLSVGIIRAHVAVDFGGDDHFIAPADFAHDFAEHFFAGAE